MNRTRVIIGSLLLLLYACVSSYDPRLRLDADLVVVDAIITDQAGPQTVTLSRARARGDSSGSAPLTHATVAVVVDGRTTLSLIEIQPGVYRLPEGFVGQVGHSYQLRFQTIEGQSYQSSDEPMVAVSAIRAVYDQYNPDGPKQTADALPTPVNDVYLNFQDPSGDRNFYLWRWRLYETQQW